VERLARMCHAASLSTQKAEDIRRGAGGCRSRCSGGGRSKRVSDHAACASAAHGERVGGSDRCDGEPNRGRLASLHETRACKGALPVDAKIPWGAELLVGPVPA